MENQQRTVKVSNYRKIDENDDVKKTIQDFFAFCGAIQYIDVNETEKKDYFSAILTFDSPSAAQVAILLNTAVIGHESEQISVILIDTPPHHQPIGGTQPQVQNQNSYSPSAIVEKLISLGYKFKDDSLYLAKQFENTLRITAGPPIENTKNMIAAHVPESIKTAGTVAYEVTQQKFQEASEGLKTVGNAVSNTTQVAVDITGNVIHNATGVSVEGLKQKGHVAMDVTAATIHNATEMTANTIHSATEATTNAIKNAGEVTKSIGNTIATTGQVTYEVTAQKLSEGAEVVKDVTGHPGQVVQDTIHTAAQATGDALKTVGAVVSNTGQIAYDVTGNTIHQVTNATIEASQVAAATVASVYEANKSIPGVQATANTVATIGGAVLDIAYSVASTTTNTISNLFSSPNQTNQTVN